MCTWNLFRADVGSDSITPSIKMPNSWRTSHLMALDLAMLAGARANQRIIDQVALGAAR